MKKQTYSSDQVKTSTFNDVCFFTKLRLIAGKFPRVDKHRAIIPWQEKLLQVVEIAEITVIKDHVVLLRTFNWLISILWQRCDDGTTPLHNLGWYQMLNNKVKENQQRGIVYVHTPYIHFRSVRFVTQDFWSSVCWWTTLSLEKFPSRMTIRQLGEHRVTETKIY